MTDRLNLPSELNSLIEKRELEERRQEQAAQQGKSEEHPERRTGCDRRSEQQPPTPQS